MKLILRCLYESVKVYKAYCTSSQPTAISSTFTKVNFMLVKHIFSKIFETSTFILNPSGAVFIFLCIRYHQLL